MTATPFCLLPVTHLNGSKIGNGKIEKSLNYGMINGEERRSRYFQQIRDYSKECKILNQNQPTPLIQKT